DVVAEVEVDEVVGQRRAVQRGALEEAGGERGPHYDAQVVEHLTLADRPQAEDGVHARAVGQSRHPMGRVAGADVPHDVLGLFGRGAAAEGLWKTGHDVGRYPEGGEPRHGDDDVEHRRWLLWPGRRRRDLRMPPRAVDERPEEGA